MESKKRKPKKRKIDWKKVIITSALAAAGVAFAYDAYQVNADTAANVEKEIVVSYEVQPGDTLWGIAKAFYGEEKDVDEVMYIIKQDNNIGDAVPAGKKIMIRLPRKDQ